MPFARNARGVQGLRASRRARFDCPARDNRMPMQVPAGAEGASAAEGRAAPPPPPSTSLRKTFGYSEWGFQPAVAPPFNPGLEARTSHVTLVLYQVLHSSGVPLPPLFLRISLRFRWPRRRRKAKWGAPDPGPRPSGDQGIYLACLPARNIRPSHSPSTWARPTPPW